MTEQLGFEFQVISPTRVVLAERVTSLIVPGARGAVGFWAGHAPMLVALAPGVVKFRPVETSSGRGSSGFKILAVGGGFFEISADGQATLLADTAELPEEIDADRAEAAYQRAKQRLVRPTTDHDALRAEASLQRALARLKAAAKN